MAASSEGETGSVPARPGLRLVLAGCIPFLLLVLWLGSIPQDHVWRDGTVSLLKTYAALVLSFLGGARFGVVIAHETPGENLTLAATAIPVFAGWLALLIGEPGSFALLAVAFAAHGAWDSLSAHRDELPVWYGRWRVRLTVFAVVMMVAAFLATA